LLQDAKNSSKSRATSISLPGREFSELPSKDFDGAWLFIACSAAPVEKIFVALAKLFEIECDYRGFAH